MRVYGAQDTDVKCDWDGFLCSLVAGLYEEHADYYYRILHSSDWYYALLLKSCYSLGYNNQLNTIYCFGFCFDFTGDLNLKVADVAGAKDLELLYFRNNSLPIPWKIVLMVEKRTGIACSLETPGAPKMLESTALAVDGVPLMHYLVSPISMLLNIRDVILFLVFLELEDVSVE